MARISGITIPSQKLIWVSLSYIYGIGQKTSLNILKEAGVDPLIRTKDLTDNEISKIQDVINEKYIVEGDLSE
jgi:Ribosomal protein S13